MIISGTGITSFEFKTSIDFKIDTRLSINWFKVADGNWKFTDRGASTDIYESDVKLHAISGSVDQVLQQIEANRVAESNVITLSTTNYNEKIFGPEINYTVPISATVINDVVKEQARLKSYEVRLRLRAISPTFTGSGAFPDLKYLNIGYSGDIDKNTINKLDSYTGSFSYIDHQYDAGLFTGTFIFTEAELIGLRQYMRLSRGTTTSLTGINGVTYPFGINRGAYPFNVKLLDLTDLEMRGIGRWFATIKMAEVV